MLTVFRGGFCAGQSKARTAGARPMYVVVRTAKKTETLVEGRYNEIERHQGNADHSQEGHDKHINYFAWYVTVTQ